MNILLVLIPVTLVIVIVAVRLFFWAVNHQQFDDLDSPAILPLLDEPATDSSAGDPPPAATPAPAPAGVSGDAKPPEAGGAGSDRPG
ncbi:cbb3-type cytochrome oxidase maturation protein [Rhodanobacter sp. TND4EL1]